MRALYVLFVVLVLAMPAAAEPQGVPVRAADVVEKEIREGRAFVGTVRPLRRSRLGSGVEGFVQELKAREGQRIEAGAVIARLEMDVIQPELEAARAKLEQIDHRIAELENGTRDELITEAKARVAEGEVTVQNAIRKLETAKRLRSQKHVSGEEVRDAEDAVTTARAMKRRLEAMLGLLEAGTRVEQVEQAKADRKVQVAQVKRLEALEKRHTVKAPFAGYVVEEHTEEGAWLSRGDPVITLESLDVVRVRFPVLEDYVGAVAPGAKVAVLFGAFPDRAFDGEIERIVPSADARARTVPVDVIVKNERTKSGGILLKSGMFAATRLPVGEPRTALLVPLDALVLGGATPMVFVILEDGTAAPVPVVLDAAIDGQAVVTGALKPGTRVVTEGNERLRPGMPVTILED